jgi:hypothetical protein
MNRCFYHPLRFAGLCLECDLHNTGERIDPAIEFYGRRIVSQALQDGVAPGTDGPGHDAAAHHIPTLEEWWKGK